MRKNFILAGVLMTCITLMPSNILVAATGPTNEKVAAWVSDHVKALQATPAEKRFDEIGWVRSIVQAEQLARQYNRPVFLFTHNGKIDTGRC